MDHDIEERAYNFLRSTLIFIAQFLETGVDELVIILEHVFDQHAQPFYVNSSVDLHEEISDLGGPRERDAFEDEEKMQVAVFAELDYGRTRKEGLQMHHVEGRFISNLNAFGRWNGFRRIRDAIVEQQETPSRVQKIHFLLNPMYKVKDYLTTEFLDWFMEIFPQTTNMILNLSDDELKTEASKINDIVDILCSLYRLTSHMDSPETVDKFRLDLALKGLRSPILERRLTGLGDITDFVEVFASQQAHASQMQTQEQKDGFAWIAQDYMCNWLMSNKILDEIFVRNVHAEVLKRSIKVLMFLASNHRLGELEVKMIWDASLGQHESISKMIHELLSKTACQLHTPDVLLKMLWLIGQQPISGLTVQHIWLAKRIASILMQLGSRMQMQEAEQFAGMHFLWGLTQDESHVGSIELQNACVQSFTSLISMNESRVKRAEYFEKCIKNLRNHRSVPPSLVIMNYLFVSLASKRKKPDVDWSTFGCLKDEQELLSLIIDDLVQYRLTCQPASEGVGSSGGAPRSLPAKPGLTPSADTPRGLTTPRGLLSRRQDQIARRLEFVTSILQLQGTSLSRQHLKMLWSSLVQPGFDSCQREISLKWFQALVDNQWTREAMAPSLQALFQMVCGLDPEEVTKCAFELFRRSFVQVNVNHGNIVLEGTARNHPMVATGKKLLGTDFLWQVSLAANDSTVANQAISLLNDLYQSVSPSTPHHLEVLQGRRQEHLAACLQHMKSTAHDLSIAAPSRDDQHRNKSQRRISRCIAVLRNFLHDFEVRTAAQQPDFCIRKHGRQLAGGQISIRLQQFGQSAGEAIPMRVDCGATLLRLREHAGMTLGEDTGSLRLIAKGKELKGNQKSLADFRLCDGDTVHWTKKNNGAQKAENCAEAELDQMESQEKSPEFRAPHEILSQDHFDNIFALLDLPSEISTQVWKLLMVLPTNQLLKDKLRALGPSLASALCPPGIFTQLYTLQIVEILLFEDDEKRTDHSSWRASFIESGGVANLLEMVLSERFSQQDSDQCNDCLSKLLNLLYITMIESHDVRGGDKTGSEIPGMSFLLCSEQVERFIHVLLTTVRISAQATNVQCHTDAGIDGRQGIAVRIAGYEAVAKNAMRLLVACVMRSHQVAACVYTFECLKDWLSDTIVRTQAAGVRQTVCQGILKLVFPQKRDLNNFSVSDNDSNDASNVHAHFFFLEHLLSLVCHVKTGTTTCSDFFDLVTALVQNADRISQGEQQLSRAHPSLETQLDKAVVELVASIKSDTIWEERNSKKEDEVLRGHLRILRSICVLRPHLKALLGGKQREQQSDCCGLIHHLVDCLFGVPSRQNYDPRAAPKCKRASTRLAAFELLLTLTDTCPSNAQELLTLLHRQHQQREVRSLYMYKPWQFDRAACGFVGLRNLGATCYMNSLLQQLFFVPECRSNMLQMKTKDSVGADGDSFLFQLQLLFAHLQESEKQYYDPWDLCQTYTDYEGKPVNINQQMDVDEFLNVLFEKIEQGLKGTPQQDMLHKSFGGKIVHQIICKEPVTVGNRTFTVQDPYKSEREESFFALQLEVKHKRNILESLQLYVDGEVLEGDNKYMCEGSKVDAVKRVCIKELPKTLILHLKRFEFDLDCMKKVKVNDCCEFPLTLDMDPYTLDGIERREKAAVEAALKQQDGIKISDEIQSDPNAEYDLVGVLVHTGTADSGHYYSYIKDRDVWQQVGDTNSVPRWHLFNDIHVEPFDSQELGSASFGGSDYLEEPDPSDASKSLTKVLPKAYNAYMLFYERRSAKLCDSLQSFLDPVHVVGDRCRPKVPIAKEVADVVVDENIRFLRDKHTYDPDYFSFLKRVCHLPLDHALEDEATMLAVNVLMDVMIHSWDTVQVAEWVSIIQTKLLPDADKVQRSVWLLESFTQSQEIDGRFYAQHWLKKALIQNRVPECRASIVQLLLHAVRILMPFERRTDATKGTVPYCAVPEGESADIVIIEDQQPVSSLLTDYPFVRERQYRGSPFPTPVTTVGKFMESMLDMLPEVARSWRHFGDYFELLARFADIGVEEKAFLLARRTISRCIETVLFDDAVVNACARGRSNLGAHFPGPDLESFTKLVSTLARSATVESMSRASAGEGPNPFQICDAGPLDPADKAYLKNDVFLTRVLADGINPDETMQLVQHLSWNNSKMSSTLLSAVMDALDEVPANEDGVGLPFQMLEKLVNLQDALHELRCHHITMLLVNAATEKMLFPETCANLLEFLGSLAARQEFVRVGLIKLIVNRNARRDDSLQPGWFMMCLIRCDSEQVQMAWEKLARAVGLPEIWLLQSKQAHTNAGSTHYDATQTSRGVPAKVQGDDWSRLVFDHLLTSNEQVLLGCEDLPDAGVGLYPLRSYFSLLCFFISHCDDGWYKERVLDRFALFHDVLKRLNDNEGETDLAKAELFRFMHMAADGYPALLDVFTDPHMLVRQTIVENYILVRPHRINIAFNRQHLPRFYRLLLVCCLHSTSFIEYLLEARELLWAIEHLMCKSCRYPETASVILEVIDVILSSDAKANKVSRFCSTVREYLMQAKDLASNPQYVFELSNRVVFSREGEGGSKRLCVLPRVRIAGVGDAGHEQYTKEEEALREIVESQLLGALLAAIGPVSVECFKAQSKEATPKNQRTQSEVLALRTATRAIEMIKAIFDESESLVDSEIKGIIENGLKEALQKCKMLGCDQRHQAVSAIMLVLLPADDLLSIPQRVMTLQVIDGLCSRDLETAHVVADALLKLHEVCKLRPLELVRLEHLQGGPPARAQGTSGTVASVAMNEVEHAWTHVRQRSHLQSSWRVVEVGPACRARISDRIPAQTHLEIDAMYARFVKGLCTRLVPMQNNFLLMQGSREHLPILIRLLFQCSIDFLPSASHEGPFAMHELLYELMKVATRAAGEAAVQQDPGTVPGDGTAVHDSAALVQILGQEPLVFQWIERVLLCYKEGLEIPTLRCCAELMLATAAPAWSSGMQRQICDVLVSDLTDLATAVGVLKSATGPGAGEMVISPDARAEAVARAVLRELRPLALVDNVPVMLAVVTESHGEVAGVEAAREALEAADCSRFAATSQLVARALSQVDEIVQAHRQAIVQLKSRRRHSAQDGASG